MRHPLTLSVIMFSLFSLVSCGNQQKPTATNTATPSVSPSSQGKQPIQIPTKSVAIGETVSLRKYKFTVNGVRDAVGDSVSKPKAGQKYLLINATVENQGQKQEPISSIFLFALADNTNKEYERVITTETKGSLDNNLAPGKKLQGEIAFEVPKNAKNLLLILRGDLVEPKFQAKVKLN